MACRRVSPASRFLRVDSQLAGPVRIALRRLGGGQQVVLRHQVRVDVVVGDGAVLVRSGHPVNMEPALAVVVAERPPQPRRLHQQFDALGPGEVLIGAGLDIAHHGGGDIRVDVEGRRAGGPVARAFLAGDRPPRESRAPESQLGRPLLRGRQRLVPPAQRAGGGIRGSQGQRRQHEHLGVPEGVPVVARPGEPLGRDRALLAARAGLQNMKQSEPHGLLDLDVTMNLDVGAAPEVVEVGTLRGDQAVPARLPGPGQRRPHLVPHCGQGPLARPAVRDELDQPGAAPPAPAAPRR